MQRAWSSLETPAHRLRDVTLEVRQLPLGAGPVERAERRGVHRRCKAPGSCGPATTGSGLRHLRAAVKAGRWNEILLGVMTDTVQAPSFEPVNRVGPQRPAAIQERETPQTFVTPPQKAA